MVARRKPPPPPAPPEGPDEPRGPREGPAPLRALMRQNFVEYASYVIVDRAIPDVRDGLKPVQRRILATLRAMDDGRFHKVANVIGETMKLHPHGDASIGDALVVLANKEYLIERQGNFGNLITGHAAAAPRYTECRLTPLARETLFNEALTETQPSYDGRRPEPVFLPSKLPLVLLLGAEGIAVGMSTRLLPHNFNEVLAAQVKWLEGKPFRLLPDFPQGGQVDVAEYDDGRGRVKVRARIEPLGDKKVVIREVPFGTTTESLIASIEGAAQKGKVKIAGIQDYTTDKVEIQVELPRGVNAEETIPALFAYTDCEVSVSCALTVIRDRRPADLTVTDVLAYCTARLRAQIKAELELELAALEDRRHGLTLEQIFIEQRVWKRLEGARTDEAVRKETWEGMHEHAALFVRPMVEDDVPRLLKIPIRRISAYDVERYRSEMEEIRGRIAAARRRLKNLTRTTIEWIEDIRKRYGKAWPRRTQVATFEAVDKKTVALQNIKVAYDPESGFYGSQVRGGTLHFTLSEYDRVLLLSDDGSYRVLGPEEKVLIPGKVLLCEPFDPEAGVELTVVYRDERRYAFGKRVHIQRFVRGREYELIPGRKGKIDLLLREPRPGKVRLHYQRKARQRVNDSVFDLGTLAPTGTGARGTRLAPKPVTRVQPGA